MVAPGLQGLVPAGDRAAVTWQSLSVAVKVRRHVQVGRCRTVGPSNVQLNASLRSNEDDMSVGRYGNSPLAGRCHSNGAAQVLVAMVEPILEAHVTGIRFARWQGASSIPFVDCHLSTIAIQSFERHACRAFHGVPAFVARSVHRNRDIDQAARSHQHLRHWNDVLHVIRMSAVCVCRTMQQMPVLSWLQPAACTRMTHIAANAYIRPVYTSGACKATGYWLR